MPNIYLKHEKHGYKVCHSTAEASYDKGHGWVEYDPAVPKVVAEPAPPAPVDPVPDPEPAIPDFLSGLVEPAPAPVKKKRPTA